MNLDAMSIANLVAFAAKVRTCRDRLHTIATEREVNIRGFIRADSNLMKLSTYAGKKARAMRARLAGDIALALRLEDSCDTIYACMPLGMRW